MKSSRRRPGTIDIYFVLYIAALVLLIPDRGASRDEAAQLITSLLQTSFTVHVDRSVLLCRVVRNGDSLRVLSCDSTNGIFHSGAMKDVRYEFSIEDQSYRSRYTMNTASETKTSYFTVTGSADQGGVRFHWAPPMSEKRNRLFSVNVSATATPLLPEGLDATQREAYRRIAGDPDGIRVRARAQFTVALVYVDGGSGSVMVTQAAPAVPGISSDTALERRYQELLKQFERPTMMSIPRGDFSLQPRENVVRMIAYQTFENRIRVYGADPMREVDAIRVSGGNAFARVDGSDIVVTGTTPAGGSAMVTLSARRTSDRKDTSVSFRVIANTLETPSFPASMYPGITYVFDPRLPEVSGVPAGAVLRDDRGNEVVRSAQGESFSFTPRAEDTLRTFVFERSLNEKKIGQTYSVAIVPFPSPEIIDISLRGGQVWVRTRSFGLVSDARARVRLDLGSSNTSRVQERLGDWSYDERSHAHLQVFQFTPSGSTVTVRAVNGRRQASEKRDFSVRN
ncbi:MAG: hypothetical protein ACKOBV_01890 [Candidatus Kapaibacterium sp.]